MKACPNCKYLWPDEHTGQCVECGNPMANVASNGNGDLQFRYASQIARGRRENEGEAAMKAGSYDVVKVDDSVLQRARDLLVQREEVRYEDDAA